MGRSSVLLYIPTPSQKKFVTELISKPDQDLSGFVPVQKLFILGLFFRLKEDLEDNHNFYPFISRLVYEIKYLHGTLSLLKPSEKVISILITQNLTGITTLNLDRIDRVRFCQLIGKTPNLQTLRIRGSTLDNVINLEGLLDKTPLLSTLCLQFTTPTTGKLKPLLKKLPSLCHFILRGYTFTSEELSLLPPLITLSFSKVKLPQANDWVELIRRNQPTLEHLRLKKIALYPQRDLVEAIIKCSQLISLCIRIKDFGSGLSNSLFQVLLKNNSFLESIFLEDLVQLSDFSLTSLAEFGAQIRNIRLFQTSITREPMTVFANKFMQRKTAEYIIITGIATIIRNNSKTKISSDITSLSLWYRGYNLKKLE